MPGPGIECIIFDFDGVLVDTESLLFETWRSEYDLHDLELRPDDRQFWVPNGGDATETRLDHLSQLVGRAFDRQASNSRRLSYRDELLSAATLRPGIAAWIAEALAADLRLAVATSNSPDWAEAQLTRLGVSDHFELICGCGPDQPPKPDPDVYQRALRILELPAQRAVAIEDSPHGAKSAELAGLSVIVVPSIGWVTAVFPSQHSCVLDISATCLSRILEI